jgi:carboxypeptidase T
LIYLKKKYSELLELIELPNKSAKKNKTSRAIRIHTPTETNKPAVMFTGGVHAREWGTSDICMHFIRQLLHSYKNNLSLQYKEKIYSFDQVKKIVENLDIIVFPDVNPDGKEYSQGGGQHLWRKNCNPTLVPYPNHEEEDFHKSAGVDLNRNFDFLWYSGIGTVNEDNTNQSQTYRGPTPFSEPESRNVKSLFDQYKNIKCFVDIHCHVGQILMSWGHDDTQCFFPEQNFRNPEYNGKSGKYVSSDSESGPEFYGESYGEYMHPLDANTVIKYGKALYEGLKAVRGREYELKPSVGLYPTSGTSQDYAFSQRDPNDKDRVKIFAYTIEFGQRAGEGEEGNFTPPYSVMRKIMDDIASALTELCYTIANEKDSI